MELFIGIQAAVGALYMLMVTAVGIRLLMLARRSGARPELLLGLALLLGGTFGGPLEAAGVAGRGEIAGSIAGRLLLAGKMVSLVAVACQGLFVWRVFRPQSSWGAGLVVALLSLPVAGFWGFALNGTFATGEVPTSWFWVELIGRCGVSCWMAVEGARYYRLMTRRLRLGLADPVVTNRFLLWSLAGGLSVMLLLASVPPTFLDPVADVGLLVFDLAAFSAIGVAISILYFLTFFPPRSYRQRLVMAAETAK